VHQTGMIHRDIAPDNIIMSEDGSLTLLDFGSARYYFGEETKSLSVVLKPGYAPYEQYSRKGKQGAWTDVYALCATIYKCITGETPPDALDRAVSDELKKPSELGVRLPAAVETALMKGLAVFPKDRLQTVGELRKAVEKGYPAEKAVDVKQEKDKSKSDKPKKKPTRKIMIAAIAVVLACAVAAVSIFVDVHQTKYFEKLRRQKATTILAGENHTFGLKLDGTVSAIGCDDDDVFSSLSRWSDIKSICASPSKLIDYNDHFEQTYLIVGLNSSGDAIIHDSTSECQVNDWHNIVAVCAGLLYVVGLKSDGTVVVTGQNNSVQHKVNDWSDIVAVSAGYYHTVGLKADGTVVATGNNQYEQCNVDNWSDIVAISAGYEHTVGLKSDGTVVATGENDFGQCKIDDWSDIVAVSAGYKHTVGLKADGTVVATGYNDFGQCNVNDWTDIVAISAGYNHTVGLKSDGTVVAVGDNTYHQCDVSGWKDIKLPEPITTKSSH